MVLIPLIIGVALQLQSDRPYYVKSRATAYYHVLGGMLYSGTINEVGDFVPLGSFKPRPVKTVAYSGGRFLRSGKPKEPVYEYRCGRLIPGVLGKEAFIPDFDGKVIEFKAYQWSPTARRIYNLPGRFISKEDYEALRLSKELADEDIDFNKDR